MTPFQSIIDRTKRKIEKDPDFFSYYNISEEEIEELVKQQILGYIPDAIDKIYERMQPDIDWYDYDYDLELFNVDLTQREIGLLSSLMYQVFLERQESLLGAFKLRMTPSDLSSFSPKGERDSFLALVEKVRHENDVMLSVYASTDRETNQHKQLEYSSIDDES